MILQSILYLAVLVPTCFLIAERVKQSLTFAKLRLHFGSVYLESMFGESVKVGNKIEATPENYFDCLAYFHSKWDWEQMKSVQWLQWASCLFRHPIQSSNVLWKHFKTRRAKKQENSPPPLGEYEVNQEYMRVLRSLDTQHGVFTPLLPLRFTPRLPEYTSLAAAKVKCN